MANWVLTKAFREFFDSEKAGGLLLVCCTGVSLIMANSGAGPAWLHFWHTRIDLSFAGIPLDHPLEYWINDGLMAIFFLLVGLEIERELYIGELADLRQALLPIMAAAGGMLVPAVIHYGFNHGQASQSGFGIPMATDIAFALGVLALLGSRVPLSARIFLTALAIIDDLGAILVIAFFYTRGLSGVWLAAALGIFLVLLIFNRLKINLLAFYCIPGAIMWYCMLRSGIHATLSGVLLAFAIPFRKGSGASPSAARVHSSATGINPSETLQHVLHKPVAFIILPLFALANTGILLTGNWLHSLGSAGSLGIGAGLIIGKPIGILLFSWLAIRSGLCRLPEELGWRQLTGLGILAGIGFTMSIFITNLAFEQDNIIRYSKIAILLASAVAGILGFISLRAGAPRMPQKDK